TRVSGKDKTIGAEALGRMLTAYPQTKTYCSHWARFCTGEDARRQHHGVGNIDDLVGDLTNLSKLCFQAAQSGPCQLHGKLKEGMIHALLISPYNFSMSKILKVI
uniref:Uncharacterized protein n=1 Tax=Pundamilia nyererei TaxID=303518 RepID=A0A3B4FDW5_9CICH